MDLYGEQILIVSFLATDFEHQASCYQKVTKKASIKIIVALQPVGQPAITEDCYSDVERMQRNSDIFILCERSR